MDILIKISIKISLKSWYFIMPPFFKVQLHVAELARPFSASKPSLLRVDWAYDISNTTQYLCLNFLLFIYRICFAAYF